MKIEFITNSEEETFELGLSLGKKLHSGSIIALYGDLAAGKTTFVKGVASGVGGINSSEINSPTFNFLNIYEGLNSFYHFDLYRLKNQDEFLQMGFDEYLEAGGICCIEWAERMHMLLPEKRLDVSINHHNGSRKITIESDHEEINF